VGAYLDNAASTPLHPELIAGFADSANRFFVNPASAYPLGQSARRELLRCEQVLLTALGIPADEAQIIWTSGGTEANNLALRSFSDSGPIVVSAAEHSSVGALREAVACPWRVVPIDAAGSLDLGELCNALDSTVSLVSVHAVQNETGARQDTEQIAAIIREHAPQARLHHDAVQLAGKLPLSWAGLDMLTLSGHKLHGPGGAGALIVRKGVSLTPQILGGEQQGNLRSGSIDVCGVRNLAEAVRLTVEKAADFAVCELRNALVAGLSELSLPNGRSVLLNSPPDGSPYIVNASLPGYEGAVLVRMLGMEGIMVAAGSACSAATRTPSAVLLAMGRSHEQAFGALRFSFGIQSTPSDVEACLAALRKLLKDY